jgi:hypothetical protein
MRATSREITVEPAVSGVKKDTSFLKIRYKYLVKQLFFFTPSTMRQG